MLVEHLSKVIGEIALILVGRVVITPKWRHIELSDRCVVQTGFTCMASAGEELPMSFLSCFAT